MGHLLGPGLFYDCQTGVIPVVGLFINCVLNTLISDMQDPPGGASRGRAHFCHWSAGSQNPVSQTEENISLPQRAR